MTRAEKLLLFVCALICVVVLVGIDVIAVLT